jgi:hypothetical protein
MFLITADTPFALLIAAGSDATTNAAIRARRFYGLFHATVTGKLLPVIRLTGK